MTNTQSPAPGVAAETTRLQFEQMAAERLIWKAAIIAQLRTPGGDYHHDRDLNLMWLAWTTALQASAAAVEPVLEVEIVAAPGMRRLDYEDYSWWNKLPTGKHKLYTAPPLPAQVQAAEPVMHLRQYGDVKSTQMEQYLQTGTIAGQPDKLEEVIDAYLESYELNDGESRTHQPNEFEAFLIKDAIMGLLADPGWDAEWGAHISSVASRTPVSGMAPDKKYADAIQRMPYIRALLLEYANRAVDETAIAAVMAIWTQIYSLAASAPGMAGGVGVWQPIETAPKDKTRFLATTKEGFVRLVHWDDPEGDRFPISDGREVIWPTTPTHWMPLDALAAPHPSPAPQAAGAWQSIDTAPTSEATPFLVKRRGVVLQVSWFEGRLYPDAKEACIDWEDGITDATEWMSIPEAGRVGS